MLADYDLIVCDLDGVVYLGPEPIDSAIEFLNTVDIPVVYATNNASRRPETISAHLSGLGLRLDAADVVTSAQGAAAALALQFPPDSPIFVIGGDGLQAALEEEGLRPVVSADDDPVAVVQGYGPEMPWRQVIAGAMLVRDGLPWVATNLDLNVPTPSGIGPGIGRLVALVAEYAGRDPDQVLGKPAPGLFRYAQERFGAKRPVVLGDNPATDVAGANACGWDSVLVLTGVTKPADVADLVSDQRPTHVVTDLRELLG